jgi:DNA-binding transcriptional regulator GbsR (MarR family)
VNNMRPHLVPKEIEGLAQEIGGFIEHWGFKKIHGEIWTHIWLAKNPLDATTLVKRLNVSKALISLATKDLIGYEVIRVVGQGNRRKILLEANRDIRSVIAKVVRNREAGLLENVMGHCRKTSLMHDKIKSDFDLDEEKIQALQMLISVAQISLAALIDTHLLG